MILHFRSYRNHEDKYAMTALAKEFAAEQLHVIDLPYRLSSWSLDEPENIRLWFDENERLVGWAVLQTPFWTIDYVCHPSLERELHPQILAWADERARAILHSAYGHPAWYVMVFDDQKQRIHDLELAGFMCQADVGENSWSKVLMRRPGLERVKVYPPPAEYEVRSLASDEVEPYVELHRSVFESRNMTVEWRQRTIEHREYRRDLDVVVVAPDGELVAFCVCWFDETTAVGHVEPLGCHKDFRKYALGRVALSHGLYRLETLGCKEIFVETDSYRNTAFRLYEFFDFEVIRNVLVYRREYPK
jgi:hypothetical protein